MQTLRFCMIFIGVMLITTLSVLAQSASITGVIKDKKSGETIIGATIQVVGTSKGTATDIDGRYMLALVPGKYDFLIRCVGYKDVTLNQVNVVKETVLNIELEESVELLGNVDVTARKKLESERVLQMERQQSITAIENIGAKEMSIKGVSNVQEGVKKITGISIASAGQLIVRGLGDRYSTTTLNGLPIASPNPDNKLIPLDLFPSSTVQNITVSKVYEASQFADYAGAHIDISTKTNTGTDFFQAGLALGGAFNTLGNTFRYSDHDGSLLHVGGINHAYLDMPLSDFERVVTEKDIFGTSFSIDKKTSLPDFSASVGWGRTLGRFNLLLSCGISNDRQILKDAFVRQLTAQGTTLNSFNYDNYTTKWKLAGLAGLSYNFENADYINYSLFYARNAVDEFMERWGFDSEGINLRGSNSVYRAYSLLNNQMFAHHSLGERWELNWAASYGLTTSDEPDRRQVMFREDEETKELSLFLLNQQETMRYFGELDEDELVGDLKLTYNFGEENNVRAGITYKRKTRDFMSVNFYYEMDAFADMIMDNIYDKEDYLNFDNVANGSIVIDRNYQKRGCYNAEMATCAGFAEVNFFPWSRLLVNLGVRYEQVKQTVDYFTDASAAKQATLDKGDFFPAINLKYTFDEQNSLRFAFSRTVTRPAFVEMAPFLYRASYGGSAIRGNENINNGYNLNVDLRFDRFDKKNSDMLSLALYFKCLQDPIERVQESEGGSTVHTFQNAENGIAMGVEIEVREELFKDFRVGFNGSYMYTDVKLTSEGGIYTDSQRALQGASPYLLNADISYTPRFKEINQLILTLMYNLQGPRIHAVGIYGLGDNKQLPLHTMDFVGSYSFGGHWEAKFSLKDLLNSKVRFRQDVPEVGEKMDVESFRPGMNAEIGITYKF